MKQRKLGYTDLTPHHDRLRRVGHRRAVGLRLGAAGRRRMDPRPSGPASTRGSTGSTPRPRTAWAIRRRSSAGRSRAAAMGDPGDQVRPGLERSLRALGLQPAEGGERAAEAEGSLRRLGVDVIDLYQIHWPNPDADVEEAWTEIARMIEEGKIRYAGASNFSISQMRRAQAIHPVASLQPPYSLLDQTVEGVAGVLRRERHRRRRRTARWHPAC